MYTYAAASVSSLTSALRARPPALTSITGAIDGQLGTNSWKAMQRFLKSGWDYNGAIDGIVGSGTVKALQRWLKSNWGYTGALDGIAGPGTKAALARYCDSR